MSRRRTRRISGRNLALVAAASLVVAALVWAGLRLVDRDDPETTNSAAGEVGVAHVHGLGVDPADGSLIVATHYGSFRIPADGDAAERIGDSFQDTMGFTVAGARHYLGSGHPDVPAMQEGQPTRLGLIESTNGGRTWTILSLGGEVDFHALAFAHDQVYGWDSSTGRFLVSADKREWETRSTLDLSGFAVDPADRDRVVAAGPDGLTESTDGGRTWQPDDGPRLVTLSWDADAGLWGAAADGAVWQRNGASWDDAGDLPGEPQAFLATADALYAAAHDAEDRTAIYQSTDAGGTWDLRYRDPAQ